MASNSHRLVPCAALLLLAATACGNNLADLPSNASLTTACDLQDGLFFVQIAYDPSQAGCLNFGDLKASIDGVSVPVSESGEKKEFLGSGQCLFPSIQISPPPQASVVHIAITDGTHSVEADYASPCAPRTLKVIEPADGALHDSQQVTLQWEPDTDVLGPLAGTELLFEDLGYSIGIPQTQVLTGGLIQFTMPGGYRSSSTKITVNDQGQPKLIDCQGVSKCIWQGDLSATGSTSSVQ